LLANVTYFVAAPFHDAGMALGEGIAAAYVAKSDHFAHLPLPKGDIAMMEGIGTAMLGAIASANLAIGGAAAARIPIPTITLPSITFDGGAMAVATIEVAIPGARAVLVGSAVAMAEIPGGIGSNVLQMAGADPRRPGVGDDGFPVSPSSGDAPITPRAPKLPEGRSTKRTRLPRKGEGSLGTRYSRATERYSALSKEALEKEVKGMIENMNRTADELKGRYSEPLFNEMSRRYLGAWRLKEHQLAISEILRKRFWRNGERVGLIQFDIVEKFEMACRRHNIMLTIVEKVASDL